jgi:hypothetical protein
MWLATIRAVRARLLAWPLAALGVAFLWPAFSRGPWHNAAPLPPLFATSEYRQAIGPHEVAIVLPVGSGGPSMLWQASADFRFSMASGYALPVEAPDPYQQYPIYPTLISGAPVPNERAAAQQFLSAAGVTVALLDPSSPITPIWTRLLGQLGWTATARGGVVVLRPRTLLTATGSLRRTAPSG